MKGDINMPLTKDILDSRICDIEECENTQTYREFIRETENAFGVAPQNLDNIDDEELNAYLDYLDDLWIK